MTTTEHLDRIRARCVELLALAEKRTPGEWGLHPSGFICTGQLGDGIIVADAESSVVLQEKEAHHNALFIASCAGAAEAGWRSTIAAIDGVLADLRHYSRETVPYLSAFGRAKDILTAWPEELL